eukprot:Hpha_TRINITY_DN11290_c0_g1::TRINITY_DN11290_c0_g1_i1::g.167374::m.167374
MADKAKAPADDYGIRDMLLKDKNQRVRLQLNHVKTEVSKNDEVPLALPHLRIYEDYLAHRVPADIPGDLSKLHEELQGKVGELIKKLGGVPESGDKEGSSEVFSGGLKTPMVRRKEAFAAWIFNFFTVFPISIGFVVLIWWVLPTMVFWSLYVGYMGWVYYANANLPWHGPKSYKKKWLRNLNCYKHYCNYLPIRLVRWEGREGKSGIDKKGSGEGFHRKSGFLMGIHPHGVVTNVMYGYVSEGANISKVIPPHVAETIVAETLPLNFWFPLLREYAAAIGFGNCTKKAIHQGLSYGDGATVAIVIGGAKESLFAKEHSSTVALHKRYGFIKCAFKDGASIVPCWSFGENSVYDNIGANSPRLSKLLRTVQKSISFAPLIVRGRGMFNYRFGLLPFRRPITSVIGEPIPLEKNANPTEEEIVAVHRKYIQQLADIVDLYRDIYDPKSEDLLVR